MVNSNPIDLDYIVSWQSDLENTKERPLHKPSQDQSKSTALAEFEILRNGALAWLFLKLFWLKIILVGSSHLVRKRPSTKNLMQLLGITLDVCIKSFSKRRFDQSLLNIFYYTPTINVLKGIYRSHLWSVSWLICHWWVCCWFVCKHSNKFLEQITSTLLTLLKWNFTQVMNIKCRCARQFFSA